MSETVPIKIEDLPLGSGVRVLESNADGLVALDKPAGIMSHPNYDKDRKRSLLYAGYDFNEECFFWKDDRGIERKVWLINRLDSPTSGVILVGLNAEIKAVISEQFSTHKVTKVYYAIVRGHLGLPTGKWVDTLSKDVRRGNRIIKGGQKIPCQSDYKVLKSPKGGFPVSLLRLAPLTGRTHQLRLQCKKRSVPIVGDDKYGHFGFNKEVAIETGVKRMLLHSGKTSMKYAFKGKPREFSAETPMPEAFKKVLDFRPGLKRGNTREDKRKQTPPPMPSKENDAPEVSEALAQRRFKSA